LNVWNRILSKEDNSVEAEIMQDPYRKQSLLTLTTVQTIPKSLVNPLYKLKNILCPAVPSTFKTNHQPLLSCLPSMPHMRLWSSLYLDRTSEPVDIGGSNNLPTSSPTPYVKSMDNLSVSPRTPSVSPGSRKATPSPNHHGSVFLFSANQEPEQESSTIASGGRNFVTEQKLVDLLLLASSNSTKFQKHTVTNSETSSGGNQLNSAPAIPPRFKARSTGSPRRNPFLE